MWVSKLSAPRFASLAMGGKLCNRFFEIDSAADDIVLAQFIQIIMENIVECNVIDEFRRIFFV